MAKCNIKNQVKYDAQKRGGASFGRQTCIGQPIEVNCQSYVRHMKMSVNLAFRIASRNACY